MLILGLAKELSSKTKNSWQDLKRQGIILKYKLYIYIYYIYNIIHIKLKEYDGI